MKHVIVSSRGWYFQVRYWLQEFEAWQDEVDDCYIVIPKWFDEEYRQEVLDLATNPKVKFIEGYGAYPQCVEKLINELTGDILLMHDDTFIHKKGLVAKYFKLSEKMVVTPLHKNYGQIDEIESILLKRFPDILPLRVNDQEGFSFLPCFTFISRWAWEMTSKSLNLGQFKKDEWSELLQATPKEDCSGEAGFTLAIELMSKGVKIYPISEDGWEHAVGLSSQLEHIYANPESLTEIERKAVFERRKWWWLFLEDFLSSRIEDDKLCCYANVTHFRIFNIR